MRTRTITLSMILVGLLMGYWMWRADELHKISSDAAREDRVTSVVQVAPAPLPSKLPLVGPPGSDADGYPLIAVDRPALRSLLWHGKYRELSSYVEEFQNRTERDWHAEYWILDAAETLGTGEKELLPALDAWVAVTPDNFAPYLARGYHWVHAAYSLRGSKFAAQTPKADLGAMRDALVKGLADLDRALRSQTQARHGASGEDQDSYRVRAGGRARCSVSTRAKLACPHCMQHRVTYMLALRPRWGGSYELMEELAIQERDEQNPRTRFLAGYPDVDYAHALRGDRGV